MFDILDFQASVGALTGPDHRRIIIVPHRCEHFHFAFHTSRNSY